MDNGPYNNNKITIRSLRLDSLHKLFNKEYRKIHIKNLSFKCEPAVEVEKKR